MEIETEVERNEIESMLFTISGCSRCSLNGTLNGTLNGNPDGTLNGTLGVERNETESMLLFNFWLFFNFFGCLSSSFQFYREHEVKTK